MRELSISDLEVVSGGAADWDQVGTGFAAVALGLFIIGNPIGWIGFAAATAASYAGGVMIGNGLINGEAFDGDE